jgi:hypothetical protein
MREAVERLGEAASDCAGLVPWSSTDEQLVAEFAALHVAQQAVTAAMLHWLREVEGRGLPAKDGATSTAVWVRRELRVGFGAASTMAKLAQAVDQRPELDAALMQGRVNAEQAAVIARSVGELPDGIGPQLTDQAEAFLIEQASSYDPAVLRKFGARILTHVAPDLAEAIEGAALEREEKRAHVNRAFTLTPTGDGRVRVTGWLDNTGAGIVRAAIDPLSKPTAEDHRSAQQRRADALVEVCGLALETDQLPQQGGQSAQLVVTVPYDLLRKQLGAGILDTGEHLAASEVRRLACHAGILPAVLDGEGQPLDVGRSRRAFTPAQRRAIELRDGGCAFPGCDRPPRWAQCHHIQEWTKDGGPTSIDTASCCAGSIIA